MRKVLSSFLAISLLTGAIPAHALIPFAKKSSGPLGYMAGKKQFSACELNFVSLLEGKISGEVVAADKTNLWSSGFSARNYLDELLEVEAFANAGQRSAFLEDLAKLVHKDETYLKNVSELATLMKNEGLVSPQDLRQAFLSKEFTHAKFVYSSTRKKLLGSLDIDPAKTSAVEKALVRSDLDESWAKEYRQVLRSSFLSAQDLELALDHGLRLRPNEAGLERLRQYLEFLQGYGRKKTGRPEVVMGLKNIEKIYQDFDPRWYNVDKWFRPHKEFLAQTPETASREAAVKRLLSRSDLPKDIRDEYFAAFRKSQLGQKQIEHAIESGLRLRADTRSLERFKEYLVYLDYLPDYKVRKALEKADEIYRYSDESRFFVPAGVLPPHKQFIAQRTKIIKHQKRRYETIVRDFKEQEKEKLMRELDDLTAAKERGEVVDEARIAKIKAEVDEASLSPALIARARSRARGEASIYRKLINGCNGGGSAQLASAAKKFGRFKMALALGGSPVFYLSKNWDKKDSDPYFWEKLGQEMTMTIMFTLVSSKIVTNTNKGFWARYLDGYVKFAGLDMISSGSYDWLFGRQGYARYFQQFYNGGVLRPSEAEKEFEKLKNSPTFDEDVEALTAYLEKMSKKKNLKNWLDKYFNLSAYSSLEDNFRITQEDLESEEAREVMMALLAERMYLSNMGDWPLFQTGSAGTDRWAYYRAQNSFMDIKTMALNIAIFEIMCREPLGKIGSWGLVLGLTVGNWFVSGKLSYGWRREAINQ